MSTSANSKRSKRMATPKTAQKSKTVFSDLPLETQKEIIRNVYPSDLFTILRVSKHFFSLATAEIYRTLDFNFTSADGSPSGAPASHIAEAIQVIVASDRNYGQHIKSFRLGISEETSHNSLLMNRVLWDSVADPSKVLNTLILLLVKKSQMMETFQWDTPIELSGAVYQALHRLQSLHHLRVRLDVPSSMKTTVHQTFPPTPQIPSTQTPSSQLASAYAMASNSTAFNNPVKMKNKPKRRTGAYDYWSNGRAFSGFRNLCSLTLLGISSLDCLGEIAACLKASSISLRSLTLSLSTELAHKARKPVASNPAIEETSDTEPDGDDEEEVIDASTPHVNNPGQPVNEADIRKEKLAQEAILARIFDLQGVAAEGKKLEKTIARVGPPTAPPFFEGDGLSFAHDLKTMLKTLLDVITGDLEKQSNRREALVIMQKAAEKYLSLYPKRVKNPAKELVKTPIPDTNKFSWNPPTSAAQQGKPSGSWGPSSSAALPNDWSSNHTMDGWTIFSEGNKALDAEKQNVVYPESYMSPYEAGYSITVPKDPSDTNFYGIPGAAFLEKKFAKPTPPPSSSKPKPGEHAYEEFEILKTLNQGAEVTTEKPKIVPNPKSPKPPNNDDSGNESESLKKPVASSKSTSFPPDLASEDVGDSMDIDMEHPDENTLEAGPDQEIISELDDKESTPRKRARFAITEPVSSTPESSSAVQASPVVKPHELPQFGGELLDAKSPDEEMRDYIRATHGLQLEELSLYLIPLKASILARALDLNVLKRLTLLSVGPQEPFWSLLTRLQSHSTHVSFESVYTDQVSPAFLECLKNFDGLEELFILERSTKGDPADVSTSKPNVNIISLRKALRKHIKTLKRLMIKNENDESWDIDAKTIRFLSTRGAGLVELGISLNMKHYHILMQQLPGFKSLVALQFFSLRSNDRSALLQIESLTFAADTISHLPDQKIKYLALENHMTIIERKPDFVKKYFEMKKERKQKMKGKGKGKEKSSGVSSLDNSSDSDDIDELAEITTVETRLRFGVNFWEVREIKMFRKHIRTGKL